MSSKSRNKIHGPFVAITHDMMYSPAFRDLKGNSLKALIFLLSKVTTYDPALRYITEFKLTYPEVASEMGIHASSFSRSLKQLKKNGFIDCVHKGGLSVNLKNPSIYRLSRRWEDYKTSAHVNHHPGHATSVHGVTERTYMRVLSLPLQKTSSYPIRQISPEAQ